jgi:iron complex outermembrane receptor protein
MSIDLRSSLLCAVALSVVCLPHTAVAQDSSNSPVPAPAAPGAPTASTSPAATTDQPADTGGLTEIVVTAQKRAENIQDVPIAISAFTQKAINDRGIISVQQLGSLTPGVNFDETSPFSGSYNVLAASIRGVGQDDFALNVDPGVGVYVDGVYLARTVGSNQDLMDVQRIEVLKGPQGTLFGRNTIGGAISIVTLRPTDEFSARARVTLGSRNRRDIEAYVNVPLAHNIFASVAASERQQDGFQKRIPFPGASNYYVDPFVWEHAGYDRSNKAQGGHNVFSIRGKLLAEVAPALDITLSGDWSHEDSPSTAATVLSTNSPNAFLSNIYNACISNTPATLNALGLGPICGPRAVVGTPLAGANVGGPGPGPRLPWGDLSIANTGNIDTTYANGLNFTKIDSYGGSATADYKIGEHAALKSITAYRELHWKAGMDNDGSILAINEPSFPIDEWQFSQELQLTGQALNGRLSYVGGVYYFREQGTTTDYVVLSEGLIQASHSIGFDNGSDIGTKSYAAYAHVNWKVTDSLGITLGARYTKEEKTITGNQADLNEFVLKAFGCGSPPFDPACVSAFGYPVPASPERLFPPGLYRLKYNVFSPRIGAEYHFNDNTMAYASYSRGFKAGGFNERLTVAATTAPAFRPEKNDSYEVGIKTEILDRRVRFNVAGFVENYKDIQLLLTLQGAASPLFGNSGDARIKGFEAETNIRIARGLRLDAGLSYLDAHYTKVEPNAEITIETKLPKAPKWKFYVSPSYELALANGGVIRLGADYTHTTKLYNDEANNPFVSRGATDILNAHASYVTPDEKLEFTVGGKNITDERYKISGFINLAAGAIGANYSAPAEWYASVGAKF